MTTINMSPSRLGMVAGTGADDALFLRIFGGEVMSAFDEVNVMRSRHFTRSVSGTNSAQFPATWKAEARYHTPGQKITGQKMFNGERVINIDGLLISDVSIAQIDEAKLHFDLRQEYTRQTALALSNQYDKTVLRVGVNASRATAANVRDDSTDLSPLGGVKNAADADTDVEVLEGLIKEAAIHLDENDIPQAGRATYLRPAQYHLMLESDKLLSKDYSNNNGDVAMASIHRASGIEIVKTNNVPKANLTDGFRSEYDGDFSDTVGLVMLPSAVGTLHLLELQTEGEWLIEYQTTLIVSKYAVGHGILRPECAIELSKSAT